MHQSLLLFVQLTNHKLDEMNWSARGNVLNQYLSNTSIGTTVTIYDIYKQWKYTVNRSSLWSIVWTMWSQVTFIGALHLLHCLVFLFGSGRFPVDFRFSASNNAVCSATKNNSSNYYIIISYIKRIIMQFVVCFVYDNICVGVNNCLPKVRWYQGIFAETKSRWIFPNNHRAWGLSMEKLSSLMG
jgi:hypothetical protein